LRRNKALDPTALVGCPQASLLPSAVLAGQRRDCVQINKIKTENRQPLIKVKIGK